MPRAALLAGCLLLLLGLGSPKKARNDNGRICQLPVNEGLCKAKLPRWHYDKNTQTCKKFSYGGCQGNANNFRTKEECEQICQMINKIPKECRLKPNEGKCGTLYRRYFFNINTMTCEKFYYGGCKGNENRFPTKFSCMDHCLPEKSLCTPAGFCLKQRRAARLV
ncbi:tissue factor pathway inhibitor 2-like [Eublepharis macularius]|uniref:Tissue factor pathway inhibitor 2-like n=1 Tax=Eublepharis macularius TaxID=481883 RepID=A0AA97LCW0_EUBMA|nr:tissue factor pathway inhibitor 2-like [Eublepharis macularius]